MSDRLRLFQYLVFKQQIGQMFILSKYCLFCVFWLDASYLHWVALHVSITEIIYKMRYFVLYLSWHLIPINIQLNIFRVQTEFLINAQIIDSYENDVRRIRDTMMISFFFYHDEINVEIST